MLTCRHCDAFQCDSMLRGDPVDSSHPHAHLYPPGFTNAGVCPHEVDPSLRGERLRRVREMRISFAPDVAYALVERRLMEAGR
jgi:hypothetical protein